MVAKPETQPMKQAAFATFAGVSRKTVTNWKAKGFVVMTDDGLVDVARSVPLLRDRGYGSFEDVTQGVTQPDETPTSGNTSPDAEGDDDQAEEFAARAVMDHPDFGKLTIAEAERFKENFLALKQRMSYLEAVRALVNRREFEAHFAARWSEERAAWENWPSSVAANMAAELGVDQIAMRVALEKYVHKHLGDRVAQAESDVAPAG